MACVSCIVLAAVPLSLLTPYYEFSPVLQQPRLMPWRGRPRPRVPPGPFLSRLCSQIKYLSPLVILGLRKVKSISVSPLRWGASFANITTDATLRNGEAARATLPLRRDGDPFSRSLALAENTTYKTPLRLRMEVPLPGNILPAFSRFRKCRRCRRCRMFRRCRRCRNINRNEAHPLSPRH